VTAGDVDIARQFLGALAEAARTGDRNGLLPLLAPDVEWVTPQRDLGGIDQVRDQLTWIEAHRTLDLEFEQELTDLGDGRVVSAVHETYRIKESGDFAYARDRRIELTIRDEKITRYEMREVG
jgi:ketosteroid isomerase-like protein